MKKVKYIEESNKINIFKRFWYSFAKPSKYKELSKQGIRRTIIYLMILIIIASTIYMCITYYMFRFYVNSGYFLLDENQEIKENYVQSKILVENNENILLNKSYVISYFFTGYFLSYIYVNLINISLITIIGLVFSKILKLKEKMKINEIFVLSMYSVTASIVINLFFIVSGVLTNSQVSSMDTVYFILSSMYLIIALCMIKYKEKKEDGGKNGNNNRWKKFGKKN